MTEEVAQEQADREQRSTNEQLTKILSGLTIGVGFLQLAVIAVQAFIARKQNRIMEGQSAIMRGQVEAATASAAEAAKLVELTKTQQEILQQQHAELVSQAQRMDEGLRTARDNARAASNSAQTAANSLATNREIERAYISIGHSDVTVRCERDGHGGADPSRPRSISVNVHIRNDGRTPGDLIGGFFGYRIATTPGVPDITRTLTPLTPAFLMPNKAVSFGFEISDEPQDAMLQIIGGETRLWLIGEADYIDRFGQPHTGGYGRMFDPKQKSFVFVGETGPWNFDRPMHADKQNHYQIRDGEAYTQRQSQGDEPGLS